MPIAHRVLTVSVLTVCCLALAHRASAQNGTIAGTITEDGTGTPLGGGSGFLVEVLTANNASLASAFADASGHYAIQNLPPGTYYVKVAGADGHVRELHDNVACIAADCVATVGTPVAVASNATATVNFSLAKEGRITGNVVWASGSNLPIASGNVLIYNASTSLVYSAPIATDGTYAAPGLATGSYYAWAQTDLNVSSELYGGVVCPKRAPAGDCRITTGTLINVTAGATTSGIDFALDAMGTISGTIVADGTGAAITNIDLGAYIGDELVGVGHVVTPSGGYLFLGLPAGDYRVRTMAPANVNLIDEWQNGLCVGCPGNVPTVHVGHGQNVSGINFSVGMGGTITGSVTCIGSVQPALPPSIRVFSSTGTLVRTVQPSACGSTSPTPYTVTGLPGGTYYLLARDAPAAPFKILTQSGGIYIDQLYGGIVCNTVDCDVRSGVPVTVISGSTTIGIDLRMAAGASTGFSPSVVRKLTVYDSRGVEMVDVVRGNVLFAITLEIIGLPPGTYFVKYGNQLHGGITCLDCPPTSGAPVVIKPGDTTFGPLSFGNEPELTISGTVTTAAGGAPLSTINVDLISSAGNVVGTTITDLLGHYAFSAVAAGTYFARTRNDRGFVDEAFNDQLCASCDPRSGTPIVVTSSNVAAIDFALAAGGIVQGTVAGAEGGALGNVPVSLFAGTSTLAAKVKSSAWGLFRTTLPVGTYRARAEATTTRGAEVFSEMPCTSATCDPSAGTPITVTLPTPVDNVNFTLASCSAMTLSPSLLATAVDGRSYRQVFSATGGVGPYLFDVTDGQLPLGLNLDHASGVLSGAPTATGRSTFRLSALAANGCATDRTLTLDVQDCAFTLSPASVTLAAAGGTVTVSIADACGSQEVTGLPAWVQSQGTSGTQVMLSVMVNTLAAPRSASIGIGRRTFDVRQAGLGSQPPFGSLDLPTEGQAVSGAVAVTGWALDDLDVARVLIYRDAFASEPPGMVFVGTSTFVPGARPDVQQAFATFPASDRAGWGFMILTNMFPNQGNGTFRIHAIAQDAEGQSTLLGSRTIVSNNATAQMPFGTIDRPAQGETIAGANYLNWGWALTPQPGMIPTDGSTIRVVIDGVPLGTVTYNLFRADVSGLFPGLANSNGPVGYRAIDTTTLAEGLHTISWLVTDDRPATSGIGSRFFTVANSADAPGGAQSGVTRTVETDDAPAVQPLAAAAAPESGRRAASMDAAAVSEDDVMLRRGDAEHRRLRARRDGAREMTIAPMERVELALGAADASCPVTWAGYLVTRGVLSDLPVGASLDPSGTFYWQTGPGFAGRFPLLFVRTDCQGRKQRLPVVVTVHTP